MKLDAVLSDDDGIEIYLDGIYYSVIELDNDDIEVWFDQLNCKLILSKEIIA